MAIFKSPEEAIAACEAGFEAAWMEFSTANGIKTGINPDAYNIAKKIFHGGYANGAKFISDKILSEIQRMKEQSAS